MAGQNQKAFDQENGNSTTIRTAQREKKIFFMTDALKAIRNFRTLAVRSERT